MYISGISGGRRGRQRILITSAGADTTRPVRISGGWPITPPSGPQRGSAASASPPTCSPGPSLGWRGATSQSTPLVTAALEQSLVTRHRTWIEFTAEGLLHHSGARAQYTSPAVTEALAEAGITSSIGSVGDAMDNALMESTVGLYKIEVIDHQRPLWNRWRRVQAATAEWVHWCNCQRLHSRTEHGTSEEFEQVHYDDYLGLSEPAAALNQPSIIPRPIQMKLCPMRSLCRD